MPENLLLTGVPGCGKTTVVRGVVERLGGVRVAGFDTREVRREGRREGFEVVGLGGRREVLARVVWKGTPRVGRYGVRVDGLEAVLSEELARPADVFVLDEVGRMECLSGRFVAAVRELLDAPVPLLATVALRGGGLVAEVKAREDVEVLEVTRETRDELPERLARCLLRAAGG